MKQRKVVINEREASLKRHLEHLKKLQSSSKPPRLYPDQNKGMGAKE